jgi:hypothetical protein
MRVKFVPVLLLAVFCTSCKKDKKPSVIEVTVQLQDQTVVDGATVLVLSDQHKTATDYVATGKSGADGKIDFTVTPGQTYYLYYNGANQENINNQEATFITMGTFTSQQQIDNSPQQPGTTVIGGPIYEDINGDGVINNFDKILKVTGPASGGKADVTMTLFANNAAP